MAEACGNLSGAGFEDILSGDECSIGFPKLMGCGWRRDWGVAPVWLALSKNLFLPKAVLAARVLAAESQLALCQERLKSQGVRRHRFSDGFRWLWVVLA